MMLNPYQFCHMFCNGMHLILRCTTVFQCKCDIFANCQTYKLTIRVLQHSSNMGRQFKDAALGGIYSIHLQ